MDFSQVLNKVLFVREGALEKLTESDAVCPCGNRPAIRRRQNTNYVDDELNHVTLCVECHQINDEYWNDMWRDYYGNIMS